MERVSIRDARATTGVPGVSALLLALLGAALAGLLISRSPLELSNVLALLGLTVAFVVGLNLSALQWLPLGERSLLVLFALRPLLDATQLREAFSKAGLSLQNAYAMVVIAILLVLWRKSGDSYEFRKAPNSFVLVLLALAVIAWVTGGLSAGANGFVRTAWGLVVALFLGPLFRTERQIDIFIRTVFYSSMFILLILSFNLTRGEYLGESWRVGGQYGVPNALAAVAFTLFLYGLYVAERARKGRTLYLSLLMLLAAVIVLTQSRTVGMLLVGSVCVWLWMQGHRRLLYRLGIAVLAFIIIIGSGVAAGWRLTSVYSFQDKELSQDVVNLTGRAYLWTQTLGNYADANLLHKTIGLGWGAVFQNFLWTDVADVSSVTENSFLWFLAGTGALGLIAFCAYLVWMASRTWTAWRSASSKFERDFALLALLAVATFVIEGSTTDLVLSPVASGHLYAVLSIFVSRWLRNGSGGIFRAASGLLPGSG